MFGTCRKGWIGIEWGTQALKLAQVERNKGSVRVAASAIVTRKPEAAEAGGPVGRTPPWSSQDLRTALASDPRFSGRNVACVLPMHLTDVRSLAIPAGTIAERYAMVANEVAAARGATGDPVEFDFWESDTGDSSHAAASVNTLAVSRRVVTEVTQTLSQAGLVCEVLDGLPLVLSRAVGLAYDSDGVTTAVLDWEFASSTFCVVRAGNPMFTRHLRNCGLSKLFETVGRTLNLPEEEVAEVLTRYGLPDESSQDGHAREIQDVIVEAARPHLSELVEELQRTIAYMGTQHAGVVLDRFCLTGDGAVVRHADRFLSRLVGLPVDVWGLPAKAEDDAGVSAASTSRLGAAIALSALGWTSAQRGVMS
jgi:type IV pilus assembly protein PilM